MNVAEVSIGSYFLLGSGDGFVYEKFGDNGDPGHSKPVVYKYDWHHNFVSGFELDPAVEIWPVKLILEDPSPATVNLMTFRDGQFFLRDTEPENYYQYFKGFDPTSAGALKFHRLTAQYLDLVILSGQEMVRHLFSRFVLAIKEV